MEYVIDYFNYWVYVIEIIYMYMIKINLKYMLN